MDKPPSAFFSYCWEDETHKAWVQKLASRLRTDGIETILDQWHAAPGDQLTHFMEDAVRNNDFVLVVCTPKYKTRSDGREGGVGYEGDIMTGEVLTKRNHRKFIPILCKGTWPDAAPSWMAGKYYIDLSGNPYSENQYRDLLDTLLGLRLLAPAVGVGSDFENISHPPASRIYKRHTQAVNAIVSWAENSFLSGSSDNTIRLWNIKTGRCIRIFSGHTNAVSNLAIVPESHRFISSSWDKTLRVWDIRTRDCLSVLKGHRSGVLALMVTHDGKYAISGAADFTMRIWHLDPNVQEYNREIIDFSDAVRGLAISPDDQTVFSCSDNKVQAWEITTGKCLATFQHSHNVCGISITSDGRRIISCMEDGAVQLWDIAAETPIATLSGHGSSTLQALAFSDDRYLVSCSDDHTARMWDIKTGKVVAVFEGHDARVNSISLTQDCTQLITGSSDMTIGLWPLPDIPGLLFSLGFRDGKLCDMSSNQISLRVFGNVDLSHGENSVLFGGGHIDLDQHPRLDNIQAFIIEGAITPYNVGGERQNILEAHTPAISLHIDKRGGLKGSIHTAKGWMSIDSGIRTLKPNTTNRVYFSMDETGNMQLRIDDHMVAEKRVVGPIQHIDKNIHKPGDGELGFRIGAWMDGKRYLFKGKISEINIMAWKKARLYD